MTLEAARLLKLRAVDDEDLRAISVVIQDALVPVHDMTYLPAEKRFVLAMNRFRWELGCDDGGVYERVNSGLCFDNVSHVELRGFSQAETNFILDLLHISYEGSHVLLSFAGYRDLRLTVEGALECRMDDFGQPWPTKTCPHHTRAEDWQDWADAATTQPA